MDIEQRTPMIAKKLWGIIRAILYMVKKNLSKTIPWFEFHMMLKRSTKLAGKAIGNLLLDHQTLSSALTCRPNNIRTTFITPVEYEFSCSNTPLFHHKRKNNRHRYAASNSGLHSYRPRNSQELTVGDVRKVFDILNNYESESASAETEKTFQNFQSPLTLLGLGMSPNVRRLRVTDSPFPVNCTEDESGRQVDVAAEEFIKNFYKELKLEKNRATVEPPSPLLYRKWGQVR
ncbi:hypothetical protein Hdeb2414_s0027g00696031 [Helianthus debilis subsp. tardiflorus]